MYKKTMQHSRAARATNMFSTLLYTPMDTAGGDSSVFFPQKLSLHVCFHPTISLGKCKLVHSFFIKEHLISNYLTLTREEEQQAWEPADQLMWSNLLSPVTSSHTHSLRTLTQFCNIDTSLLGNPFLVHIWESIAFSQF